MKSLNFVAWGKRLPALFIVAMLAACGGGGSDSGTGNFGNGSGGSSATATVAVSIVDSSDVAIASNSISSSAAYAKAVVKTAGGAVVANKLVTFSTDTSIASLVPASALTDTTGIARVRVTPLSLTSAAAGTLTATATIDGAAITGSADYQVSAANVVLTQFAPSSTSITALQSSAVTVRATVNGTTATTGQVTVNFSASCGSFSPTSAASASDGTVSSVYQSLGACSGPVTLTAQATGSAAVTTSINVVAAKAANLLFDSTDQTTIYTSRAASGVKQATLKFKVVNAAGEAMASQSVLFSLSNNAVNAGVTFSGGSTATQTVSTNASGLASITVAAGPLPTPVVVTATLASDASLTAGSLTLAVTSGIPTQNAASMSAGKLSIEAFNYDGVTTSITFRVADRQGNPVPDGTAVTFVASSGLIQGSCTLSASACTVTYTSQGTRPSNGRAVILAYLDGEESFIDTNGNNYYDDADAAAFQNASSTFDVGTVFRDDNEDGIRQDTEQIYPGGVVGSSTCPVRFQVPSVQSTCDGVWTSSIRVRRQLSIALATSRAVITKVSSSPPQQLVISVADTNGNAMPDGSTVAASMAAASSTCAVSSVSPATVTGTSYPTSHLILLNGDAACSSSSVAVTVTSPLGIATTVTISP
ncbi:hypothetical protein AAFF27_21935 [Xylophilus sp. GW821-FHT01B05]